MYSFNLMGYHVSFKHFTDEGKNPNHSRKCTLCKISKGDKTYAGVSICNPVDTFSRARGREIAFCRALRDLDLETKRVFIEKYFEICA